MELLIGYYKYYEKSEINKITVFDEYLNFLWDHHYTVFISIKDEGTVSLTKNRLNLLSRLGLKTDLENKLRRSYVAIIENNTVQYEEIGENTIKYTGQIETFGIEYTIQSGGYGSDSVISSIIVNGVEYSKNRRGINIVVFDPIEREVIDSVVFDMFYGGICYR